MPATIRPRKPAGRNRSIAGYAMSWPMSFGSTYGNACAMSASVADRRGCDASATMIHGHGPQRVVHRVEEERSGQRVLLAARREHALRDVAAAARLRARIPDRPPLDRERDDEDRQRRRASRRNRAAGPGVFGSVLCEESREPADRRLLAGRSRPPRSVPVIVIPNWIESVTRTPQSPDTEAKKIVMTEQTRSVRSHRPAEHDVARS